MTTSLLLLPPAVKSEVPSAPRITHVRADCAGGTVTVTFTKPVALDGVYLLGNTASIISEPRYYGASMAEVVLDTTSLHPGTSYPLTVTGVHDLETPAALVEPNPALWSVGCGADCGSIPLTIGTGVDGRVAIAWAAPSAVLQTSTNLLTWLDLPAATSPHLATPAAPAAQFFRLRCEDGTGPAPVVLQDPDSALAGAGATVRLRAAVTGLGPLHYQWRFNGTNLTGATNQTLTLAGLNCAQSGVYELRATNALGAVTSGVAYVAASNDACGLAFNTTFAEPPARVLLLNSQNPPDFPLNTTMAEPLTRVLLLSSQNPPDFPLNTTMARPPVFALVGTNQTGGPFGNTNSAGAAPLRIKQP